jgi:SAM-dependent methyltransferase
MHPFGLNSNNSILFEALSDKDVVTFVKNNLKKSYISFFKNHETEVAKMIDQTFTLLLESQKYVGNKKELRQIVRLIDKEIFKKNRPYFWFNRMYNEYKKYIRPRKDFERIKQYIEGKTVLDFGSGTGYLALELKEDGYDVLTTDILDYRVKETNEIPFIKMTHPVKIPYPDDAADTAIVKTVLHHIDKKNIESVIQELSRVAKKLIIEEDIYDLPKNFPGLQYLYQVQPTLKEFLKMSPNKQYLALCLVDFFSNAVAFGKLDINLSFQFKTITDWQNLLEDQHFQIQKVILTGFDKDKVTRNCQVWMVYQRT